MNDIEQRWSNYQGVSSVLLSVVFMRDLRRRITTIAELARSSQLVIASVEERPKV